MRITMPRGDCKPIRFEVKNKDGTECDIVFDEIYVTFKTDTQTSEMAFQKRLSNGDITKDKDGYYYFTILPEDTDGLDYSEYSFDIQLYKEKPLIKQTILGTLELTEEVTFAENEV